MASSIAPRQGAAPSDERQDTAYRVFKLAAAQGRDHGPVRTTDAACVTGNEALGSASRAAEEAAV
jgi:hypothetical protein